MSKNLKIILVDDDLKEIKQFIMPKPKLLEEVKAFIEKNISKNTIILNHLGKDKYIVKTQKEYENASYYNQIFVRNIESGSEDLAQSLFTRNLNKLPESKQDIITEKYTCSICLELIKDENPLFCYVCQKIFHHKCLENWEKQQKEKNKKLSCPNCRNELPLNKWKEKLDFKETRENDANIMSQMNSGSLSPNEYIIKSNELFEKILRELNEIYSLINSTDNKKLTDLIDRIKNNISNPSIDDITIEIMEQLKYIKNYIKISPDNNNSGNKKDLNFEYVTEEQGICDIFGETFVQNNKDNIALIINGKPNKLVDKFTLLKGKNNIKMIIKNDLTNLEEMFHGCKTLVNINDLKYLDLKNITSIKKLFYGCESLKDIKVLENWDVSKFEDLSGIFYKCKSLSDINALKNWNVSNCKNFFIMFSECEALNDLNALKNWDVSNANDLSRMFYLCKKIREVNALKNWNVSKCKNLDGTFFRCYWLTDISALENWDVSKCENFSGFLGECFYLENIKPLKNWNVSNSLSFAHMFSQLIELTDITPLKNWKVSKSKEFNALFYGCKKLSNLKPLENWDVSNSENFNVTFYGLASLTDLSPLKNWNVSKCKNFHAMFLDCKSLSDISPLFNWNFRDSYNDYGDMFKDCSPNFDKNSLKKLKIKNDYFSLMA